MTAAPLAAGTLRLVGPAEFGPEGLDPVCAQGPQAAQLLRLFSRPLFGYRAYPDLRDRRAVEPVADLAAEVPSIYNAGLGARATSYVVHLRPGVRWDTTPPRPVTTADVVRGFKRLASPAARSPLLACLAASVRGLAKYADDYAAAVGPDPTAAELAGFQGGHEIPGVLLLDDESLVIELARPALDFVHLLAQSCVAAAPAEYDAFVPGSHEFVVGLRSNGPYRLASGRPGGPMRWEPNPVWTPASDPLRRQVLTAIEITPAPLTPREVARAVAAGEADLPWGPPRARPQGDGARKPSHDLGQELNPYLAFNRHGPARTALARVEVRRALARALDRPAIADLVAGLVPGDALEPAWSVVPPGNDAHRPVTAAPAPASPQESRAALVAAGAPADLRLVLAQAGDEVSQRVAERCADDLAKAGVMVDLLNADPARSDGWDLALRSWYPGWVELNARALLEPLVATGPDGGTANRGGHRDAEADRLLEEARGELDPARARSAWLEVERWVDEEAVVVPLAFRTAAGPPLTGPRVRSGAAMPALAHAVDLSTVELFGPADGQAGAGD